MAVGQSVDVSKKLKAAIKAKLEELGVYVDDELPEYIMVMIANKKEKNQMKDDLNLFLGKCTNKFVEWLFDLFERLQTVGSKTESHAQAEKPTKGSGKEHVKEKDRKKDVESSHASTSKKDDRKGANEASSRHADAESKKRDAEKEKEREKEREREREKLDRRRRPRRRNIWSVQKKRNDRGMNVLKRLNANGKNGLGKQNGNAKSVSGNRTVRRSYVNRKSRSLGRRPVEPGRLQGLHERPKNADHAHGRERGQRTSLSRRSRNAIRRWPLP